MNVPNVGSRAAKPLIVTRVGHAIANAPRTADLSVAARHLSAPAAPSAAPSSAPPPPSSAAPVSSASPGGESAASSSSTAGEQASSSSPSSSSSSSSSWLRRTLYLASALGGGTALYVASSPDTSAAVQRSARLAYDELDARVRYFTEPSRTKLLPDLDSSVSPASAPRTLVIDLQDTLVHSSYSRATGWRVAKRPGAEAFLAYLASMYEIVVFTSALNTYADPILNKLDPTGYILHRLYRAETHFRAGVFVKDIEALNRDPARVVLVDKDEKCVAMQRSNAIVIPEWTGDPADTALLDLIPLLEGLVREDVADVREVLEPLKGKDVKDAVVEYRAQATVREQARSAAAGASLFGHAPVQPMEKQQGEIQPQPQQQEEGEGAAEGDEGSSATKGLWGAMPGRTKLFHSKVSQNPAEQK